MPSEPARRCASRSFPPLLFILLASACSREIGSAPGAPGPPRVAVATAPPTSPMAAPPAPGTVASTASATVTGAAAPAAPEPPPRAFVLIELAPTLGDLAPLLEEHVEKARALGLTPFVEFYANWCRPCRALAAKMADPIVAEAFKGTYVIKLNFDDWQTKLPETTFAPREIPMFYALDAHGRATGRKVSGDSWGASTPENIARTLAPFFRR